MNFTDYTSRYAVVACLGAPATFAPAGEIFETNFAGQTFKQDAADLGAVDFLSPGEVQFFANGPYYVPGSNRTWGFAGQGEVNVPFGDWTNGVSSLLADAGNHAAEVTLELRGSRSTDRNNRLNVPFDDSEVGIVWYDENNVRWLGGVTVDGTAGERGGIDNGAGVQEYISLGNDGYQTVAIDPTAVGVNAVSRVRLVQGADAANAYALIGSLAYTRVPEPAAAMLAGLAAFGGLRGRSRSN